MLHAPRAEGAGGCSRQSMLQLPAAAGARRADAQARGRRTPSARTLAAAAAGAARRAGESCRPAPLAAPAAASAPRRSGPAAAGRGGVGAAAGSGGRPMSAGDGADATSPAAGASPATAPPPPAGGPDAAPQVPAHAGPLVVRHAAAETLAWGCGGQRATLGILPAPPSPNHSPCHECHSAAQTVMRTCRLTMHTCSLQQAAIALCVRAPPDMPRRGEPLRAPPARLLAPGPPAGRSRRLMTGARRVPPLSIDCAGPDAAGAGRRAPVSALPVAAAARARSVRFWTGGHAGVARTGSRVSDLARAAGRPRLPGDSARHASAPRSPGASGHA